MSYTMLRPYIVVSGKVADPDMQMCLVRGRIPKGRLAQKHVWPAMVGCGVDPISKPLSDDQSERKENLKKSVKKT